MMKGQSSLEVLITVGVVLAFTVPVLFLLLTLTSMGYQQTAAAQAGASASSLADVMNFVYSQGPGASEAILLNVPASTVDIYAANHEAVVSIKTASGVSDEVAPTFAEIDTGVQDMNRTTGEPTGLFTEIIQMTPDGVTFVAPSQ
jgi:uncharacterized protein (UPF0333 family)